jgi:hypothetical protein
MTIILHDIPPLANAMIHLNPLKEMYKLHRETKIDM